MGPKRKKAADKAEGQEPKAKKAKAEVQEEPKSKVEKKETDGYTHWLMKSEPESRFENGVDMKYGLEDLKAEPDQTACWDGVRNYSARNNMMSMKVGEKAFFYHSNCKVSETIK